MEKKWNKTRLNALAADFDNVTSRCQMVQELSLIHI